MIGLGRAQFYDGTSARRRSVTVSADADALVLSEDGAVLRDDRVVLARWPYAEIREQDAPDGIRRFGCVTGPDLARLEIRDAAVAAEIRRRCPRLEDGRPGSGTVRRIVLWSLAAAASLILTAVYLVPVIADRIAPLVPAGVEQRLGRAVDNQVRAIFGSADCKAAQGREALAALAAKLGAAAGLPAPAEIAVLPSKIPNAFALPGGRVYLLEGLLRRAESVDEIAGVLAHELGHVAHRDGLRMLIRTGGTSFLLGLLFGDVTGGATVIWIAQLAVNNAHTRQAEAAADDFAADVMLALGRSPKPLGAFLLRVAGEQKDDSLPFLNSHPVTADRVRALDSRDAPVRGEPLLNDAEWQALKGICR